MCGIEEVNIGKIFAAQNINSADKINLRQNFYHNNSIAQDTFCKKAPIRARLQNPIYLIADDYLAQTMPSQLVGKYANAGLLKEIIKQNPVLAAQIDKNARNIEIYPKNVTSEINGHFIPTYKTALKIMQNSGENFTQENYMTMKKAALLHDIGKAYIPEKILNKKGKLNASEREVVDRHAALSYEILKNAGAKGQMLNLVKNHHAYDKNNPSMVQILQIADIWSALKQKRAYKEAFSDAKAMAILKERAQNGDFNNRYIELITS